MRFSITTPTLMGNGGCPWRGFKHVRPSGCAAVPRIEVGNPIDFLEWP